MCPWFPSEKKAALSCHQFDKTERWEVFLQDLLAALRGVLLAPLG